MIDKLVSCKDFKQPTYIADMTCYNALPEPFVECTWHDYVHMGTIYCFTHVENRQVKLPGEEDRGYRSCTIFYFHDKAFAVIWPNKWECGKEGEPRVVYQEEIRYFRLGCVHKWREMSQDECRKRGLTHHGNCWHVQECNLCGQVTSYDSSG